MLNSNEYIKVIGITAALLVFGLINSVSAIVFPESNDSESSDKISIYPDSVNGYDIQSAFTFESGNNANFSVIFNDAIAEQGQAISYPPVELAPTSALYLGYDLGLQGVANKKTICFRLRVRLIQILWRILNGTMSTRGLHLELKLVVV